MFISRTIFTSNIHINGQNDAETKNNDVFGILYTRHEKGSYRCAQPATKRVVREANTGVGNLKYNFNVTTSFGTDENIYIMSQGILN